MKASRFFWLFPLLKGCSTYEAPTQFDLGVEAADANSDASDAPYCTDVERWTSACDPTYYQTVAGKTLCCNPAELGRYCGAFNCSSSVRLGPPGREESYMISAVCSEAGVVDYTFTLCRPDVEFVDGR